MARAFRFDLKSLILLPALGVLFVGVNHAIYLMGLFLASSVLSLEALPDWFILGWGVKDDMPGWFLLMLITFFLGFVRSSRADVAAWVLSFTLPLSECFLFRNLPFFAVIEAGAVQIVGSLSGCMSWYLGWRIRRQTLVVTTENAARRQNVSVVAVMVIIVVCCSVYGWLLLNVNTFQVERPVDDSDFENVDVLVVPEEAINLSRNAGAYESFHLAYELTQKHPATKTIQETAKRLTSLGWKPLQSDWLNPEIPSSHVNGWSDFVDATGNPRLRVHLWKGQWQDSAGNLVEYSFRYTYPVNGPPNLSSLWVNGSWYPAESVKLLQDTSE